MDQVSPALQYGMDKVETCSWESSSPHSLSGSLHNTSSCPLPEQGSSPSSLAEPEVYSVRMAVESNPNESRDSTEEPLTPAHLQEQACKEEEARDYSCGVAQNNAAMLECAESNGEEVKSKNYRDPNAPSYLSAYGGYDYSSCAGQMVALAPPPLPQASTSAAEPQEPEAEPTESTAIPPCLQFGTYLSPEKQNKKIVVSLEGAELWHQFYQAGTEMIITKSGRLVACNVL